MRLWRHPNTQKYLRSTEKSHDRDDSVANIDICVNRATWKMVMIATSVYGLVLGVGVPALVPAVIVLVLLLWYTSWRSDAPGILKEKQSSNTQHVPSCTATPLRKRSRVSSEADSRQVGSVRASSATVPQHRCSEFIKFNTTTQAWTRLWHSDREPWKLGWTPIRYQLTLFPSW